MCANFFYISAHWVFSAQYLRTSLILPTLFSVAKLEKACTTGDEKTSFDFNKLSNELSEQGKNVEVGSSIEILKLADEVIKEEKAKG